MVDVLTAATITTTITITAIFMYKPNKDYNTYNSMKILTMMMTVVATTRMQDLRWWHADHDNNVSLTG